jgi:hypothetical protein
MEKTNYLPPKTIYGVLHAAEEAGIKIPPEIDKWWEKETIANTIKSITEAKKT